MPKLRRAFTILHEANPIPLQSKRSISQWLCAFHNEVNVMLGEGTI